MTARMKSATYISLIAVTVLFPNLPVTANDAIAIVDFTSSVRTDLVTMIPDILTDRMINLGKFDVLERARLNAIMREQSFQLSGNVTPESAVSMGQMLGARYLMTGHIIDMGVNTRSFQGYGTSTNTTFYTLSVSVRILDTQDGRLLFSTQKQAEEKEYQSQTSYGASTQITLALANNICSQIIRDVNNSNLFTPSSQAESKAMVEIVVTSEPSGADVEIDGVFYGNTGGNFSIQKGLHTITVSLSGYEVWNKRVMCKADTKFNVILTEAVDAKIKIEVEE